MIGLRRAAAYLPELEALRGLTVTLVFLTSNARSWSESPGSGKKWRRHERRRA